MGKYIKSIMFISRTLLLFFSHFNRLNNHGQESLSCVQYRELHVRPRIGMYRLRFEQDLWPSYGLVSSKLESVWQAIIWSSLYLIWKARNSKVFRSKEMVVADMFFEIQMTSFFWISHRFKKLGISWVDWCKGSCFS